MPSEWVGRFAHLVPRGVAVLDVAAGGGRHTRFFAGRACHVTAVDRNVTAMADLTDHPAITLIEADLEAAAWPLAEARFDAIIVTHYLHRPLLPVLIDAVAPGGILVYETFAVGQAAFGRPTSEDYLLRPGELLAAVAGKLTVLAYEHGIVYRPRPAALQRIVAVRGDVLGPL